MQYKLNITEDSLHIQGLYGTYNAEDLGKDGFMLSVIRDVCVNEMDEEGEEYLVEAGQEWQIPVSNLSEMNAFIKKSEEERLWNYLSGPVFKIKPDFEAGTLYVKGNSKSFLIGNDEKGLYIDDAMSLKTHKYIKSFSEMIKKMVYEDRWWDRAAEDTMDILKNSRCAASITSGGNLVLEYRNKKILVGQKTDGGFWINTAMDDEKHIFYKKSWKEVIVLLQ